MIPSTHLRYSIDRSHAYVGKFNTQPTVYNWSKACTQTRDVCITYENPQQRD